MNRREQIKNIIQRIGFDEILKKPPCAFCGYNGRDYWQPQSHKEYCEYRKMNEKRP